MCCIVYNLHHYAAPGRSDSHKFVQVGKLETNPTVVSLGLVRMTNFYFLSERGLNISCGYILVP